MRAAPAVIAAVLVTVSCTSGGGRPSPVATEPPSTPATSASSATGGSPTTSAEPGAVAATPADWPTYHGDNQRTGVASALLPVHSALHRIWSVQLDGAVYASPVVVNGYKIVVTENNTVYRIYANKVVWKKHLGPPVPRSSLPCGNINPLGITSTPAFDKAKSTVIVVAELANPIRHEAFGLDPVTGALRWSRNVDVPSNVEGIEPRAMQQRGALLVSGRRVYIPYGGLAGDCARYRGSVVGVALDNPRAPLSHFTVPTAREGGIWATPGPVENPGGGILVAVGNGASGAEDPNGRYDHSDSVLKLVSDQIQDSFSPTSWREDNRVDADLGSQGPAIVGSWVFIAGKSGTAYVLRRSALGGIGGEVSQGSLCESFGGTAVLGSVVYVPCTDGLRAVRISSSGTMNVLWHAPPSITGSPVIGGGRLWALDTGAGVLHMLDPATGADRGSVTVGAVTRFATPALWKNAVFVGTVTGVVAFNWT